MTIQPPKLNYQKPAPTGMKPVFWVSAFFGPFGFFPADKASSRARQTGRPHERYWIAWLLTWFVVTPVIYGLLFLILGAGLLGALSGSNSDSPSPQPTQTSCYDCAGG